MAVNSKNKSSADALDQIVEQLHETEQQLRNLIAEEERRHWRRSGFLAKRPQFLRQAMAIRKKLQALKVETYEAAIRLINPIDYAGTRWTNSQEKAVVWADGHEIPRELIAERLGRSQWSVYIRLRRLSR